MAAGRIWYLTDLNFKTDTLAADFDAAAATATLATGNFGTHTDIILVVDYDNSKKEIIQCSVDGTAVTAATRGVGGTSDVDHTSGANVMVAYTASHDSTNLKAVDWELDTTETPATNFRMCMGWGSFDTGAGGGASFGEAVSFPFTFDVAPMVLITATGYHGTYATRALTGSGNAPGWLGRVYGISTTGFTAVVQNVDGGTASADDSLEYTWIAIGTKA